MSMKKGYTVYTSDNNIVLDRDQKPVAKEKPTIELIIIITP